jgi:hypothetical protein
MGIREQMNRRPWIFATAMGILVVGAVWYAVTQSVSEVPGARQFYTNDDGKTWYADKSGLLVPFEQDGKQVVIADVYELNGHKFVAYMRRYTADSLKRLKGEAVKSMGPPKSPEEARLAVRSAMPPRFEYKKPGDTQWHDIDGDFKAMQAYLTMSSPEGNMTQVSP